MPLSSIAILFHARDVNAHKANYRIWPLIANWRAMGLRVDIIHGPATQIDADILIPHVDLSYIPDDYWAVIDKHPRVVNRGMRDIRKTRISMHRLHQGDTYDHPVIVKTVNNCGGFGDAWFAPRRGPSLTTRILARLGRNPRWQPWLLRWAATLSRYPIYDSLADVPGAVFRNPNLIVEKFLPEVDFPTGATVDGTPSTVSCDPPLPLYTMRMWIVFGDRSLGRILRSTDRYVKNTNGALGDFRDPPPEIVQARERLGVDYGKIDFVIHDGTPILIDVNITPTLSNNASDPFYFTQCADLAKGIERFS